MNDYDKSRLYAFAAGIAAGAGAVILVEAIAVLSWWFS